jgi:hypothetical protein
MTEFFNNLDWNAFWLNIFVSSIFFILSIPLALKFIPYFTIKQLNKKNKKFIVRKLAYVVQEICEYINYIPFKNEKLNSQKVAIYTTKRDLKNHRFVGLININVFNEIVFPQTILITHEHFDKLSIDEGFDLIKKEKKKIKNFREKLEKIIEIHSLHLNDITISEISELCLDIRSFEIQFEINFSIDDLIEKGQAKRVGVFGKLELAKLNEKILRLLKKLIEKKHFDIEIENVK